MALCLTNQKSLGCTFSVPQSPPWFPAIGESRPLHTSLGTTPWGYPLATGHLSTHSHPYCTSNNVNMYTWVSDSYQGMWEYNVMRNARKTGHKHALNHELHVKKRFRRCRCRQVWTVYLGHTTAYRIWFKDRLTAHAYMHWHTLRTCLEVHRLLCTGSDSGFQYQWMFLQSGHQPKKADPDLLLILWEFGHWEE